VFWSCRFELVDAGMVASEHEPRTCLFDGQRGCGDDLVLWSFGWEEHTAGDPGVDEALARAIS
jgi:hypothetical protein